MIRRGSVMSLAMLMLTSCGVVPTQYMPNGYRYNDDTPYSSPAPSRPWTDEADHPDLDHMADNTAAWQGAVYELISPLPVLLPPATTRIALATTPPAAVGDQAFDHHLRQGLVSYGYRIDALPSTSNTTLVYNVSPLSHPSTLKAVQKKYGKDFVKTEAAQNMYYLTLDVMGDKKKVLSTHSSVAVLPYEKREYARLPGLGYTPKQRPSSSVEPIYKTRD